MKKANLNLFAGIPDDLRAELVETIARGRDVRIERIVSRGHVTSEGSWYDQEEDEWVLVVRGRARVRLADAPAEVALGPGDHLYIPAHTRHRVEWTDPERDTVWVAVFWRP